MERPNPKAPKLPKAVLEMKFMKKTRERLEKESQNTEGHETLYSNVITKEMRHATGNFILEPSFIFCDELIEGRMSFKGMNPEIERIMELETINKNPVDSEMKKDVSDEVLAKKMAAFNKRKRSPDSPVARVAPKRKK